MTLFSSPFLFAPGKKNFCGSRAVLMLKSLLEKCVPNKHINRCKFMKLIRFLIVQTLRFDLEKSLLNSDETTGELKILKYLV